MKHLRTILQWALAAGIIFYLFKKFPPATLWDILQNARLLPFVLAGSLYFLILCVWDVVSTYLMFSSLSPSRLSKKQIVSKRAQSYLVSIINYPAGQAVFSYFLAKTTKIKVAQAVLVIAVINFFDLYWFVTIGFAGYLFTQVQILPSAVEKMLPAIWGGGTLIFSLLCFSPFIKNLKIFHILKQIPRRTLLLTFLARLPITLSAVTCLHIIAPFLGFSIPLAPLMLAMPIIFFFGTIPITPGGLGTVQVATIELLKNFVPGLTPELAAQKLFTLSLCWTFLNYAWKILVGIAAMQWEHLEKEKHQA